LKFLVSNSGTQNLRFNLSFGASLVWFRYAYQCYSNYYYGTTTLYDGGSRCYTSGYSQDYYLTPYVSGSGDAKSFTLASQAGATVSIYSTTTCSLSTSYTCYYTTRTTNQWTFQIYQQAFGQTKLTPIDAFQANQTPGPIPSYAPSYPFSSSSLQNVTFGWKNRVAAGNSTTEFRLLIGSGTPPFQVDEPPPTATISPTRSPRATESPDASVSMTPKPTPNLSVEPTRSPNFDECHGDGGCLLGQEDYTLEHVTFEKLQVGVTWRGRGKRLNVNYCSFTDCVTRRGSLDLSGGVIQLKGICANACSGVWGGVAGVRWAAAGSSIVSCVMMNCSAIEGGAIALDRGQLDVVSSNFTHCSAERSAAVLIDGHLLSHVCVRDWGGAFAIGDSGQVDDSVLVGSNEGAIVGNLSRVDATSCVFISVGDFGENVTVMRCLFSADSTQGAIDVGGNKFGADSVVMTDACPTPDVTPAESDFESGSKSLTASWRQTASGSSTLSLLATDKPLNSGISLPLWAYIAIGGGAAVIIVIVVVACCCCRKRKEATTISMTSDSLSNIPQEDQGTTEASTNASTVRGSKTIWGTEEDSTFQDMSSLGGD
jgi:hypothetical protein